VVVRWGKTDGILVSKLLGHACFCTKPTENDALNAVMSRSNSCGFQTGSHAGLGASMSSSPSSLLRPRITLRCPASRWRLTLRPHLGRADAAFITANAVGHLQSLRTEHPCAALPPRCTRIRHAALALGPALFLIRWRMCTCAGDDFNGQARV